jgi:anhydro-N-acetylmuramic acid kinase
MPTYRALGIMSGSSLDGLDLALCALRLHRGRWSFRIERARTITYSADMRSQLLRVMHGSALELAQLDADLGTFIGRACKRVLRGARIDLITSHGHTIFHQPQLGFSTQIGSGARIAAITGITTVCDFRSADIAHGGQGAPLVPIGEKLLFPQYRAFLNIGGICNVSLHSVKHIIGYDACIGNQALNHLAGEGGLPFDRDGRIARSGSIEPVLLERLNALPFHRRKPPRSLGREWFEEAMRPLLDDGTIELRDRMRTVVEHMAIQLAKSLGAAEGAVLVTGGGARNQFLMERLAALSRPPVEVPSKEVVDFKEALVFALLGVLRLRGEENALASVTGAHRDSVGGAVHLP